MASIKFNQDWKKIRLASMFESFQEYKFTTFRKYKPWTYRYYMDLKKSHKPIDVIVKGEVMFQAVVIDVMKKLWSEVDDFEIMIDTEVGWNRDKFMEYWISTYHEKPDGLIKIYLMKDGEHA
jgi:hypothetical protein